MRTILSKISCSGLLLFVLATCQTKTTDLQHVEDQGLAFSYGFENISDTLKLGEETDISIKFEQYLHDSLSIIIGTLNQQNKLIDTIGVIEVKDSTAFFAIVPNQLGQGSLEGIIQDIVIETDKTIIGSVPFQIKYFVVE